MFRVVPHQQVLPFDGHLVQLFEVRLQLVLGHEVEELLAVAFGVVAPRGRVPLVVLEEAVDYDFVHVRGFVVRDVLLEAQEELLEFVVMAQMGEVEEHTMGVLGIQKGREHEEGKGYRREDDIDEEGVGEGL
jgi:hypothetical protein